MLQEIAHLDWNTKLHDNNKKIMLEEKNGFIDQAQTWNYINYCSGE
jgi:uncharacterized protein YchJ